MITREVSTKSIIDMHNDGFSNTMIAIHYDLPEWLISLIITNKDKVES